MADLRHSYSNFVSLNHDFNALFDDSFWATVLTENVLGKETLLKYKDSYQQVCAGKNLVVITSVIRSPKESFHITEETRLEQTIKTIVTIKEKIPNPYIVLIEGGPVNDNDKNLLVSAGVNDYSFYDVSQYSRSGGELKMLCSFFFSDKFKELRNIFKN